MDGKARRAIDSPPLPSTLPDNTTFSLLTPPMITSPPQPIDVTPPESPESLQPTPTIMAASTFTLRPEVIITALPNTPKGQKDWVFPFRIQVWEYCFSGSRLAAGVWRNGNMAQSLNFTRDRLNLVGHRVPGFAPYYRVDFDYDGSRVKFGYPWKKDEGAECEWFDNESWKSCGECREKLWSSGPLDCENHSAVGMRVKDMDCSLLLGPKPAFKLDPQGDGQR
ncbi:uncharacterized protein M421DRAFT_415584 [Didymella exigua CBS 183.55]|uniref:Uncharacterized protein n=1 Tax=Didymella exigua CBS 183.55 TaxID=1150837 RepID=A0A6A5S0W2_9PLEO|nr:uncharacterized protein M421DRAFT_415584 [Didymella exigua CBS 183.55]KAF1933230.1 hypothetical protein M421DRAFT_415584 [Didymella exigua CBS 183.55]